MDRVILHCDCNSYFASVEMIDQPELRAVPMAVAGDPKSRHGIILAKNELAKKFGVATAEPIWQARRKCPGLVLVPPNSGKYQYYCNQINQIYLTYTDLVEPASIDESYLDVTGSQGLFGTGRQMADALRARVREELGLTISVGVSFNKVFAKMGSDYKKPDATTEITRENYASLLFPLPVSDMLFVGKSASRVLESIGVYTIGDLAGSDRELLANTLGKAGEALYISANGLDESPVRPYGYEEQAKSVGNGVTFEHDLVGWQACKAGLCELCDRVDSRLRRQRLKCQTFTLQIKDPALRVVSRQMKVDPPTNLSRELLNASEVLWRQLWREDKPLRMMTVTASQLMDQDTLLPMQMDFLAPAKGVADERQRALESAIDQVRDRFGRSAVKLARIVAPEHDGTVEENAEE